MPPKRREVVFSHIHIRTYAKKFYWDSGVEPPIEGWQENDRMSLLPNTL